MTQQRKSISKKIRFEIFKRDSFTCQYCGESAPKVILEVDHIKPVINGGTNDILNLITSCFDCNRGKSKRELGDNSVVTAKTNQAKLLQDKKQQIEMMAEWQISLIDTDNLLVEKFDELWDKLTNYTLTDFGKKVIKKLIAKYGYEKLCEVARDVANKYHDKDNKFDLLEKNLKLQDLPPNVRKACYLRAILKNSVIYSNNINHKYALYLLIELLKVYEYNDVLHLCTKFKYYSHFEDAAKSWLED